MRRNSDSRQRQPSRRVAIHQRSRLREFSEHIRSGLADLRATQDFTAVAASDPVLRDFQSPLEPLVILADRDDTTYHNRDAVTRALIRCQQVGESPIFGEILVVAGLPMLVALRRRFDCRTFPANELDQMVLAEFTDAIHGFDLSRHELQTWVVLKSRTGKQVQRRLTKEQNRANRTVDCDHEELDLHPAEQPHRRSDTFVLDADTEAELVNLLAEQFGDVLDEEEISLIVESKIRRRKLSSRVLGNTRDREAQNEYQRLRRRQGRALEKLRELACPIRQRRGL